MQREEKLLNTKFNDRITLAQEKLDNRLDKVQQKIEAQKTEQQAISADLED